MRHGKKVNHLGRKAPHRKALMANMASSLIKHKKITTTIAKAKALRTYVEPLITRSKENNTHNHRTVFAYLKDKHAVNELFTVVGEKVASRPGGYTRILKIGNRAGDNAEMALIELVDFNELFTGFGTDKKAASKRTRRGRAKATTTETKTEVAAAPVAEVVEEVAVEEIQEVEAPAADEAVAVVEETVVEEAAPVVEATEETPAETASTEEAPADSDEPKA
jgi:large subunit ribosomal protein L17